jgi:hypothetical protein
MKKFLVFLMILAVAAGAFAQGTWSVWANAQAGTSFDFEPATPTLDHNRGTLGDDWKSSAGAGIGYSLEKDLGTFSGGFEFGWDGDITLNAQGRGTGDRYYFIAKGNINSALNKISQGDLWGYYRLFQGGALEIYLEADVNEGSWGWWDYRWSSSKYDHGGAYYNHYSSAPGDGGWWANFSVMPFATFYNGTFGADFKIDKLSFGVSIPHVFKGTPWGSVDDTIALQDAFKGMVIGAKFEDWDLPFNMGVNFGIEDYQVYFGAGTKIADIVDLGLAFSGYDDGGDYVTRAGFNAGYGNDSFGFGLQVVASVTPEFGLGLFPNFWYNVLPNNLRFGLDAGFGFIFPDVGDTVVEWQLNAQLAYNFNNSGAKDRGGVGTGMVLQYSLNSESKANRLYVLFKWNI